MATMTLDMLPATPIDPVDEDDIHHAAKARLERARDGIEDTLEANWEDAYGYYKGDLPAPEEEDTSTVVSTDVSDTIEWVLPAVLKPLIESPDVVRFDPVTPEDVEQAALESDYVHTVFMKRCNGFEKLYTHIKDGLLLKNAVFCTYWDDGFRHRKETYRDLTELEMADLLHPSDGSKVRLIEQSMRKVPIIDVETGVPMADLLRLQQAAQQAAQPPTEPPALPEQAPGASSSQAPQEAPQAPQAPQGAPQAPAPILEETRYDVSIRRYWPRGRAVVENCAPEAFGVDPGHGCVDLTETRFCWYTMRKSRSELVALGYDEDKIADCPKAAGGYFDNEVRAAREDVEWNSNALDVDNDTGDESQDLYDVHRVYMRYDGDGDGIDEEYLVVLGGSDGQVMFDFYEVPCNPFSASTPFIAGHKFWGYSLFDKLRDLADHKTKVLRMLEDNLDLTNNPRIKGVRGAFVLDDVLSREVGGLWRVDEINAVQEVPTQPIQPQAQGLLDYYDKMRAERSGVDPNAQSLTSLPEESMNHAVERVLSAKEELVGLLIRVFAETGIKDMMLKLRGVLMRNLDKDEIIQLRNKFVQINPATWTERTDSTIVVGLGTGDRMRKAAGLQQILQIQMEVANGGMQGVLISPHRMAHTISELIRVQGLGDPDDFVLDPAMLTDPRNMHTPRGREVQLALQLKQQQAQEAQQMEMAKQQAQQAQQEQLAQLTLQVEQIRNEGKLQAQQLKQQGDLAKLQSDMQQFMEEMRLKWAQLAAEETVNEDKQVLERSRIEMDLGKEAIGLIERDEERKRDTEERQRDRDAQAVQAAKQARGTSE